MSTIDPEVLAHEPGWSRPGRVTRIVAVVALLLGGVAVLADREARANEAASLSTCSVEVESAIASALAPVDAMVAYVRPTRDGAPVRLSGELDAMVAGQTANAVTHLDSARSACDGISVLRHHGSLKDRKQRCLARLEAASQYILRLADDGAVAFQRDAFDRQVVC